MAFRGKEWFPPDPVQIGTFIKDKMTLTELSMDSLKEILTNAQLATISGEGDLEIDLQKAEMLGEAAANLTKVNLGYYENIRQLALSVDKNVDLVNIVLPVYNSIHLVRECVASVIANTIWPFHLTIVDDASDKYTNEELVKLVATDPERMTLLTNRKNRGFSATVNRGTKHLEKTSKYTCFLNSDVLVTPLWLTKMILALNDNPRNKIVNPATNNTAVINVPMNQGYTYQAMNTILEQTSTRKYPEIMPTGFVFLFNNQLIKDIGYLDEGYSNFGEETDFWMRAITYSNGQTFDRWRAVLADDTYVFHQRGASYATLGEEQHMNFRKMAAGRFRTIWPQWQIWNKSIGIKAIEHIRRRRTTETLNSLQETRKRPSICFVTHSVETCGGMHYIADLVNEINARGGDARVAQIQREEKALGEAVGELRVSPVTFVNNEEFCSQFTRKVFKAGLVIAATSELASLVSRLCQDNPKLTPILHAQSYEPALVEDLNVAKTLEENFRHIPNVISTSSWITKELKSLDAFEGNIIGTINPGVNRDIFYKGDRTLGDERLTVMVNINPQYPFKGGERGVLFARALLSLAKKNEVDVRVLALGATLIPEAKEILCQGTLPRTRVSRLLSTEVDLFVDPAWNHSYGMPALEAIACGVPVIGWDNRGIREYLPKGYIQSDVILPNETKPVKLAELALKLLCSEKSRTTLAQSQASIAMIDAHDRKLSVNKFIDCVENTFGTGPRKTIVVVTPHLRKHGGPTTILTLANQLAARGHKVSVATVYSDLNPEVLKYTDLPIILLNQDHNKIPACDVLITNSDNPLNPNFTKFCPQASKKIMLKLSHNPRFKALEEMGLNCEWDAIVTSSQWLADVCENPPLKWNYKPVKATRIGWYHYNFEIMRRNIKRKNFKTGGTDTGAVVISTLIHSHPSKGSQDAGAIFAALKKTHGDRIKLFGVGEIAPADVKLQIPGMEYVYSPSRDEMADLMFKTDIWVGCSHGEGLGRLALEAMTGAAACVLTDTGAEYVAPGTNALVFPVGDVNAIANGVNDLILNTEDRRTLAMHGFETAKAMGDPTELIDNLEEVISNVF